MLTIFRRHVKSCPHRSRRYRRCKCPIQVEGTLAGEKIRRALDLTSWEAAETLIREWNVTGKIGGSMLRSTGVEKAVEMYLADAAARKLSVRSVARYRAFLERSFIVWCKAERIEEVKQLTFEKVAKYRATWTNWSAYTSAKNLELLRMFLRFCVKAKWIEDNPAEELKPPKIQMAPTLPFTEAEEKAILEACEGYKSHNKHGKRSPAKLRAFCLTLRYTGLRIGDVATLRTDKLQGNAVQLYTHKTGTEVFVPVPDFVAAALEEQAKLNSNPEYFFWSGKSSVKCVTVMWQRSLSTLFKKAGVTNGHAHRYRDSFAVSLLLQGVPIEDVAILLGHAGPAVTAKHYAPFVQARRDRLEDLVRKTWPDEKPKLKVIQGGA